MHFKVGSEADIAVLEGRLRCILEGMPQGFEMEICVGDEYLLGILKRVLKETNTNQTCLAVVMDISNSAVSYMLHRERALSVEMRAKVRAYLLTYHRARLSLCEVLLFDE